MVKSVVSASSCSTPTKKRTRESFDSQDRTGSTGQGRVQLQACPEMDEEFICSSSASPPDLGPDP